MEGQAQQALLAAREDQGRADVQEGRGQQLGAGPDPDAPALLDDEQAVGAVAGVGDADGRAEPRRPLDHPEEASGRELIAGRRAAVEAERRAAHQETEEERHEPRCRDEGRDSPCGTSSGQCDSRIARGLVTRDTKGDNRPCARAPSWPSTLRACRAPCSGGRSAACASGASPAPPCRRARWRPPPWSPTWPASPRSATPSPAWPPTSASAAPGSPWSPRRASPACCCWSCPPGVDPDGVREISLRRPPIPRVGGGGGRPARAGRARGGGRGAPARRRGLRGGGRRRRPRAGAPRHHLARRAGRPAEGLGRRTTSSWT